MTYDPNDPSNRNLEAALAKLGGALFRAQLELARTRAERRAVFRVIDGGRE
jgi:hypothetical protein